MSDDVGNVGTVDVGGEVTNEGGAEPSTSLVPVDSSDEPDPSHWANHPAGPLTGLKEWFEVELADLRRELLAKLGQS